MHSILEYLFEYCNSKVDDNPYIRHGRIKRAVRETEEFGVGDTIVVELEILDL